MGLHQHILAERWKIVTSVPPQQNTSLLAVCRSQMDLRVRWRHWGRTGRRVGESRLMSKFLKFTNKSRVSMLSGRQVRSQFTERRWRNQKEKVAWGKKRKKRTLSADGHDFGLQTAEQELHPSYRAVNHEARLKVSEATLGLSLDFQRFSWGWLAQRKVTSSERHVQVSDGSNAADGCHIREISTVRTVKIHWLGNRIEHELLYAR